MKKGQCAMEFLMTYGWAILVVIVAIGLLAYFSVLNPERFMPEQINESDIEFVEYFNSDCKSLYVYCEDMQEKYCLEKVND